VRGARWPTQDQAATPIRQEPIITTRHKECRNRKEKEEEAFKKGNRGDGLRQKQVCPLMENLIAIARDSAPLRCAPRGQLLRKGKT
jgi:hypothetical protein